MGGGDNGSVRQLWELGNSRWRTGSELKKGSKKADRRLSELGWSESGSSKNEPVWLYFKP